MRELIDDIPVFFTTEQPTTCPYCSKRTVLIKEQTEAILLQQLHLCIYCQFLFIEEEDE